MFSIILVRYYIRCKTNFENGGLLRYFICGILFFGAIFKQKLQCAEEGWIFFVLSLEFRAMHRVSKYIY